MRHEQLPFLPGRFSSTQLSWSVLKKDAFDVISILDRMHWLAETLDGLDILTEQNNFGSNFRPARYRS